MNRIKEILDEKGIRQTWLAEKLGKSFSVVNAHNFFTSHTLNEMFLIFNRYKGDYKHVSLCIVML